MSILLVQHRAAEAQRLAITLARGGAAAAVVEAGLDPSPVDAAVHEIVAIGMAVDGSERERLCRRLREDGYPGAILLVGPEPAQLEVLIEAGADDFLLAPFQDAELLARVQMLRRRVGGGLRSARERRVGPLELDRVACTVSLRGQRLAVTAREYALLDCLLDAKGEVVSRAALLAKVWSREDDPASNRVEVHLSRLRDKLGADAELIETVRRAGYRLRAAPRPGPPG